ncbi:MAG: bifunctional phosphoribosylaminoimidazolecarboxamide formyltransferase/IMP cyclohydrolase, partial [bacterium]|nr:bifunctional phosphoribosylaminoimidazolecarboxamide formyltransferase/IMP cyclohydrolase [bacterium]
MAPGPDLNRRRRALLSVTDKSRLGELARALDGRGYELVASGGTAAELKREGLAVREVGELTGFPEIFGGRVKTLHPLVFGGILGPDEAALAQAAGLGVLPFDVVVVNLYEFAATAGSGADEAAVIEKIDVGGPSLLRAAAKNHARVCVLPDPAFYDDFLEALAGADGFPDHEFRRNMAAAAFAVTADYDAAIADWFAGGHACCDDPDHDHDHDHEQILGIELRYGENPHQKAELMLPGEDTEDPLIGMGLRQLSGKELSFNNFMDVIAAVKLVDDLEAGGRVACAAIKHTNPCGVGLGATPAAALARALVSDPDAAFGGVFAFTGEVDAAAAADLHARF